VSRSRHGTNPRRDAALKRNAARERVYARRIHVFRNRRTGEYYLVDIETNRAHGPVAARHVRERCAEARSCWTDEFLDTHWRFDELNLSPLPAYARDWAPVSEDELP
jgi:hypothetical protein